ncbi:MAG: type II toxin-antitoxin system RelE/ParE family toxin [Ferruginibacter sp.]
MLERHSLQNDPELFKKLNDNIWEFRTLYNKTQFRIFAFWDKSQGQQTLVISTHGLIKKTGKTPTSDLEKAERIREQYFAQKKQIDNDNIWEFRTLYNKTQFRIFAFWDKSQGQQTLVISTHGLIKKTGKTPTSDLEKAERIREQYFAQKKQIDNVNKKIKNCFTQHND